MSKGRSVPSFCVDGSSSLRKGDARVSEFGFGNEGEGGSPSGFPFRIALHEEVASTNDEVKRALEAGEPEGLVVRALRQVSGYGRQGRSWTSPEGGLYCSLLLRPQVAPRELPTLSLVVGMAVRRALVALAGARAEEAVRIKWPNDVVLKGKKVSGTLTEMSTEIDYINHVVIGAGINVNQDTFSDDIKATASSLKLELGKSVKRSELIAAVMKSFEKCYEIFIETEDLSGLQELYNSMLVNRDQEVKVLEPGNEYKAHAIGINQTGELIVRTPDGKEKEIYAGEVSVRGVYGYV